MELQGGFLLVVVKAVSALHHIRCAVTQGDPSVQHKQKKNGHDNTIEWLLVVVKAVSALHYSGLKSQRE